MDRNTSYRLPHQPPPPSAYPSPFPPPTAQPPIQIPFSDPFQTSRDPFLPGTHSRRGSFGVQARGWPPQGMSSAPPPHHSPPMVPQHSQPLPPPPPPNGLAQMPLPFDSSRRRSLGGAGYMGGEEAFVPSGAWPELINRAGPLEPPPPPPPSFPARNMPPPSPPQMPPPSATSTHLASAPRGPPTSSPFAGVRDLVSHRAGAGMSIGSILGGGGEERKVNSSPHPSAAGLSSTPKPTGPPSPGRARSSSMRESVGRREGSPPRYGIFGEPRAQSAFHDRTSEPRRDGIFGSPQSQRESAHSFRAFRPEAPGPRPALNGVDLSRPSSQPIELAGPRSVEEIVRRDVGGEGRFATFRQFGEPLPMPPRSDMAPRHEAQPFANGVTSAPRERDTFGSPLMDREVRQGPTRFTPGIFGTPMREDQTGLFRPAFQHTPDAARESIESRPLHDTRREIPRSSPPISDLPHYERGRNGFIDRPMTLEEHQRMEAIHREQQQRKVSDGSVHRSLLNLSPDFNRKGRNSPLPQAVQGAQPRHIGPGGDNPGIKMEFGRMFSGLGSGVGSATPTAGQSVNGTTTPSRMSPVRHLEDGDLVRTAVADIQGPKDGAKGGPRTGKKNGRRAREDEKLDADGRATPDLQKGSKRTKTTHHHHHHVHPHHHHHHHVHEAADAQPGSFSMLRFPSNPGLALTNQPAHHHHHHTAHAHPAQSAHHHHHHAPRSAPAARKPTTTVVSKRVLDEMADKPRKHLGSQLYTTELSMVSLEDTPLDARIKFSSNMKLMPLFEGNENCTYTVRVPRYYFAPSAGKPADEPSALEEICKRRQLWGTEIYTDDSDVIAAAVHSGWLKGDFGDFNDDIQELCDNESEAEGEDEPEMPTTLSERPRKPVKAPRGFDVHITVLLCPPLESYASASQHHITSRDWTRTHDGMSFTIHRLDFTDEGAATRYVERGIAARKQRIAAEEARRREAAAGLLMFANGVNGHGASAVHVGA